MKNFLFFLISRNILESYGNHYEFKVNFILIDLQCFMLKLSLKILQFSQIIPFIKSTNYELNYRNREVYTGQIKQSENPRSDNIRVTHITTALRYKIFEKNVKEKVWN